MRLSTRWILLPLVAVVLAACNSTPSNSAVPNSVVSITPSPVESGKTTVVGKVFSTRKNAPLETTVRLAEVIRQNGQAVIALDGANSPGAISAADGSFTIANIDAKEYAVVVGDVYGEYVIISEGEDKTKLWQTQPGQVISVGELRVNL